jgi:hypothetical protein
MPNDSIIDWIERFCGQKPEAHPYAEATEGHPSFPATGIGHSQLNELLLSLQLDRTTQDFFNCVFGANVIPDFETFTQCITEFRITAILHYGNVKYAFKKLSQLTKEKIECEIGCVKPQSVRDRYASRHEPLMAIRRIEPKNTYYLGYLVDAELKAKRDELVDAGASTVELDRLKDQCQEFRKIGEFNHHCYLDYDHMDVYVATSMREKFDFWNVSRFVAEVFSKPEVQELKLRYFDPTQAYCPSPIDKGLSEALMLKRARCAIYMVGESDTLGKDSELAATLAQGKPVIAYVPSFVDYDRFKEEIADVALKEIYGDEDPVDVVLNFLQTFDPRAAWREPDVRGWIESKPELEKVLRFVYERAKVLYDQRARSLLETHPLRG